MKRLLAIAMGATVIASAIPSQAEEVSLRQSPVQIIPSTALTPDLSRGEETSTAATALTVPDQVEVPTAVVSRKATDLVAPGTSIVLQPAASQGESGAALRVAESAAGATPSDTSDSPASNYLYVSIGTGVGIPNDIKATDDTDYFPLVFFPPLTAPVKTTIDQSTGFAGELGVGYQFDQARAELAVGYGTFGVSKRTFSTSDINYYSSLPAFSGQSGTNSYLSVFVNGYYDIPTGSKWRPYIGAGIGYANISISDSDFFFVSGEYSGKVAGGSAGAFAYQGKLGLSYEAIPKGNVFLEAAYLGTTGFTINSAKYDPLGVTRFVVGWRQGF